MLYLSEPHQYIIKIKKKFQVLVREKKIKYKKFRLLLLLNKFNQESRETLSLLSFFLPISLFYKKEKCSQREGERTDGCWAEARERSQAASDSAQTCAGEARQWEVAAWPPRRCV